LTVSNYSRNVRFGRTIIRESALVLAVRTSLDISRTVRIHAGYVKLLPLIAASLVLWWRPLASTISLAIGSDAYTHILLVLPTSLALIYIEVKNLPATPASKGSGVILLIVSLLLRVLSASNSGHLPLDVTLSLNMLGLVTWWIGGFISCMGLQKFRSLRFPFLFLFLLVPIPERWVGWITEVLQHKSAVATAVLFRAIHVPVTRDGVLLSIPNLEIEVARECSSIRSSTILVVITLVLAHLFLRSAWRKTVLVLVAIPLSIAKNAIRIFTIVELAQRVDGAYLTGGLHHNGGIIFLCLGLIADIALLWLLRRGELQKRISCSIAKTPC
jgi:exosortase